MYKLGNTNRDILRVIVKSDLHVIVKRDLHDASFINY